MLTVGDVIRALEEHYPPYLASDWDNSGLQLGSRRSPVSKVVVALDLGYEVVEDACREGAELIITHHPLFFKGLKKIDLDSPKGAVIGRLLKENISVYSLHTNLDRAPNGLNDRLADLIGIKEHKPFGELLEVPYYKLVVFVPDSHLDKVREALGEAGAGYIGNYSHCTFAAPGEGTFRPGAGTSPFIGKCGELAKVGEHRLETIIDGPRLGTVIDAVKKAHPYEEVAYDVYPLHLPHREYGFGRWGGLSCPLAVKDVANRVKEVLKLPTVRLAGNAEKRVKRVAVVSGSGGSLLLKAAALGVELMVTGDVKYHEAEEAVSHGMAVIDAGHDG